MKVFAYLGALAIAAAGVLAAFSPLAASPAGLADFCPDYGSPPRCESAVALYLAGKPGDDAIIAAVNAIIDRAHGRRAWGKSCTDLEAGLTALAAATKDPGSRSLIAGFAASLCDGAAAGGAIPTPNPGLGTTGFGPPPCGGQSSGTSGQASSGNGGSSGTSGQASSGTSGQASSGNGGSSGTSGQTSSGTSGGIC